MSSTRTLSRSFAGGEISPAMAGRIDLTSYQTGLSTCLNFKPLPQGSVENRAGTSLVREVKDSTKRTRLIPFSFSPTQTMIIEFGHQYLRFHTMGATVLLLGVPYEVATPYQEADLFDLHYVQSADVLTIVHPGYQPMELRRLGSTSWTLTAISFAPAQPGFGAGVTGGVFDPNFPGFLAIPAFFKVTAFSVGASTAVYGVIAVGENNRPYSGFRTVSVALVDITAAITLEWGAVGGAVGYRVFRSWNGTGNPGTFQLIAETSALTMTDLQIASNTQIRDDLNTANPPHYVTEEYVLTAVSAALGESLPSSVVAILNDIVTFPTNTNYVHVTAVITYDYFNVYKKRNGIYGYIGRSDGHNDFYDDNIEPDLSIQPPSISDPFAVTNNDPGAVTYFEQRRLFAGSIINPQVVWGTRTGTESNLSANIPPRDNDSISFRIAAREVNTIRHMVPLNDVLILTNSAEWRLSSTDGGGLTPYNLSTRPQSYIGANNVQPVVTSQSVLYAQARGSHVREIVYTLGSDGASYSNVDLSLMATHLFDFKTIVDLAFSKAPQQVLWVVSSDGRLLSLSYVPDQKVAGWGQHTTGASGKFESCAVVAEGNEDMLYVIVNRTIGGGTKRFVERLESRDFATLADAYFVDCGISYSGSPATTFSGLGHLEGQSVAILGDGAVFAQQVVTGGAVTLDGAVSKAHVGLPYTSVMRTLPMTNEQMSAMGQGRVKNVNKVILRVTKTSTIKAGPTQALLREIKQRSNETYDSPPSMMGDPDSEEIEVVVTPNWAYGGQVVVVQENPLPVTVQSMVLDVATGG